MVGVVSDEKIDEESVVVRDLERCEIEGCGGRVVYGTWCIHHCPPLHPFIQQVPDGVRRKDDFSLEELERRVQERVRVKSERKVVADTSMRYDGQQGNASLDEWG